MRWHFVRIWRLEAGSGPIIGCLFVFVPELRTLNFLVDPFLSLHATVITSTSNPIPRSPGSPNNCLFRFLFCLVGRLFRLITGPTYTFPLWLQPYESRPPRASCREPAPELNLSDRRSFPPSPRPRSSTNKTPSMRSDGYSAARELSMEKSSSRCRKWPSPLAKEPFPSSSRSATR